MLFLYRRFLAQRTYVRFSVSLRLGHTRGKTVINAFLTRSCRYATSADDFCSKSSKPQRCFALRIQIFFIKFLKNSWFIWILNDSAPFNVVAMKSLRGNDEIFALQRWNPRTSPGMKSNSSEHNPAKRDFIMKDFIHRRWISHVEDGFDCVMLNPEHRAYSPIDSIRRLLNSAAVL